MKKYLRLLSLFLALVISLSVFVACGDTTDSETTEPTTGGGAEELKPDIPEKNYGESFYLTIMPDTNPVKYYWVEESDNDILSDAIYNRQETVRKYLGVDMIGSRTEGTSSTYIEPFKTAVKNKDGSIDAMISHVYGGVAALVTEKYLTDFNDMDSLNLDADYWKQDFMETLSINDHMFLGFGDFNILYTYVVSFNKNMLEQYEDALDESLYDMVTNYRWTFDKLFSIAKLAYIDKTSDGKTADDTFGIVGAHELPLINFLHASNINMVDEDESGRYEVSLYNAENMKKTSDLVDMIIDFTSADYSWTYGNNVPGRQDKVSLHSGQALFSFDSTNFLEAYLKYDLEVGVLPYPMYDENQKNVGYRSLQWGGYICVPSYLNNPQMVSDTLEVASFYSDPVNSAFYDKLLGKQVADSPIDKQMLDLVWDGVCADFGQAYYEALSGSGILYVIPRVTVPGSEINLASFIGSAESVANKKIKELFKKFK